MINVFLDILFIVKIGMGVEGCAYATVIAQAISAVCCLIYIIKKFPILHLKKENFEVSFTSFRYLLALGIPMGLQFSITAIGTIIVQSAGREGFELFTCSRTPRGPAVADHEENDGDLSIEKSY